MYVYIYTYICPPTLFDTLRFHLQKGIFSGIGIKHLESCGGRALISAEPSVMIASPSGFFWHSHLPGESCSDELLAWTKLAITLTASDRSCLVLILEKFLQVTSVGSGRRWTVMRTTGQSAPSPWNFWQPVHVCRKIQHTLFFLIGW